MSQAYDTVLLLGFGGPESEAEVLPFLERVTAGRGIPPERLVEVGQHYFTRGGISPINAQNRALRDALATALAEVGQPVPVVLANRNSAPLVADEVTSLAASGAKCVLAVATAAYSGYSACRQYREDLGTALAGTGAEVVVRKLPPFYDLPEFAATIARLALADLPAGLELAATSTRLVFTTHSIPSVMAAAAGPMPDAYVAEHRWVAGRVAEQLAPEVGGPLAWDLVYQSRSGPPGMPWLEPDVNDAITELAEAGITDVVLVPIGFLSDHMEVIWDLDTQAMATGESAGVRVHRTPTVGTDPDFVAGLARRIAAELDRGPATAGPGQFCHADCCRNPRSSAPVVPATPKDAG